MKIKKRDGRLEELRFDKIKYRLRKIKNDPLLGPLKSIDSDLVAQKVISGIYDGVLSSELDEEACRIAVNMISNIEYPMLAARINVSNMHKNTTECFSEVMEKINEHIEGLFSDKYIEFVRSNNNVLNDVIDYQRDYLFDYFGLKTLEKSYLIKINQKLIERPQHLYMRVAIQTSMMDGVDAVIDTYNIISQHYITFASPVLFNSGYRYGNLASCYLLGTQDSISGIFKTLSDCAHISKIGGGIGVHVSNIRSKGSLIKGTNGVSDGIIPMLKVYNSVGTYVNQSGKRKGAFAMYLSTEHPDILEFLELKKNQGSEDLRARDLFLALWVSDLFMKKVEADEDWYLLDPNECPGLNDVYGDEYEELYNMYVEKGKYKKKLPARTLWMKVMESQIETGVPYILYKDAVNKKSNQKNIGVIKSSNLCAEILLYSDDKEYAVCNLESIALPRYIENNKFNHELLHNIVKKSVRQMNNIIDSNFYPVEEAKISNLKHRPIGIGVQGLSDVYSILKFPFESDEARALNKEIFETIYHAALEGSMELSKEKGPYETFKGSPASQGKLQFDLWAEYSGIDLSKYLSGRYDWDKLKADIVEHGLYNSTVTSLMPTASSAQIMGNTESFEQFDSCIYKRRVLSGEFIIINKYLFKELSDLGLWNTELKDMILANNGSIADIDIIPENIRALYKNIWEISMKTYIEHSADRAPFIDMTQSLNLYLQNPTTKKLNSMHFYTWKLGLKTGIYYLRTKTKAFSGKFSVNPETEKKMKLQKKEKERICEEQDENGACLLCSS